MWIDYYKPTIILGDQSAGLINTVDSLNSIPYNQLQFYNQYIVQAIKAKFIKLGYTIEELNSFTDDKIKISNLIDYTQAYIQSEIVEMLKANRAILIKTLKIKNQ